MIIFLTRTPSPLPTTPWRGPESLPRSTPVPPYTQFPVQHEGEYRTVPLSPPSSRNDEVIDESIQSQVTPGLIIITDTPSFFKSL